MILCVQVEQCAVKMDARPYLVIAPCGETPIEWNFLVEVKPFC